MAKELRAVLSEFHDGLSVHSFERLSVELFDVLGLYEDLNIFHGQNQLQGWVDKLRKLREEGSHLLNKLTKSSLQQNISRFFQ